MRVCAACRAENPDQASFCLRCGEALMRCRACGTAVPMPGRFCPSCGASLEEPGAAGAERKLVTILFADVVDSTTMGSKLDPERLREVQDAYFATMREAIEFEGGTVEKFIGDAVMAVFGVPAVHEDDPSRAVKAGLLIHRRLEELNRTLEAEHGVAIEVRVGVNTGEVLAVLGVAPEESMVTGDAVNVASRLEHAARAGAVLVSERTARAASGIRFEPVGPLELRGKEERLEALEAVGVVPVERGITDRTSAPPVVGRETELQLLASVFARVVAERRPARVTVFGEAGVGKTRLVDETEARLSRATPELHVVRGRCLPYGDGVVYWPLAEILKRFAGVSDHEPSAAATARVEEATLKLLWGSVPDPEGVAAALSFTIGLQRDDSPLVDLSPAQLRAETSGAWCSFFSALSASAPVLAIVEDIHSADPALLDLLDVLADRVEGAVLFLCPSRQELLMRRPDWGGGRWNSSSILLQPLPPGDAARLLDELLASEEVRADEALREGLLERAGGNPFFLEEVVRHLRDRGGDAVPDTVQAVLAARIDVLGALEKRVLQSAAVVGKEFWPGPIERLLDRSRAEVEESLVRLADRGLVLRRAGSELGDELEYAFRHVLTRDVAYESLPRRDRSAAHEAVGTWIEERVGARSREFAELIAHHLLEAYRSAGDARADPISAGALRGRAFQSSLVASDEARARLAPDAARGRAEAALAIADGARERAMALGALGRARFHAAEGDLAWDSFREAAGMLIAEGGSPASEVVAACIEALELVTRQRGAMRARSAEGEAQPLLTAALVRAEGDEVSLARLRIVQAFWPGSFGSGRGTDEEEEAARRHGEEATAIALRLGRPDLASAALDGVGAYYMERGLYGAWEPVVRRRLDLVDSLRDPMELGDIFATAAWCAYGGGRFRDAEGFAERGIGATIEAEPMMALYCLDWRAVARARLGEWEACLADVEAAAALLGERRNEPPGYACDHLVAAAFVFDERGEPDRADELLSIVSWVQRAEERTSPSLAAWASHVLARRGRFDEAAEGLDRLGVSGQHYARGQVLEVWCDIVADRGTWDRAGSLIEDARAAASAGGLRALPCSALRLEGLAAGAAGDAEAAVRSLARAVEGFDAIEAVWEAARTRVRLAEALWELGDHEAARATLRAARAELDRLGSIRELARASALADWIA